MLSIFALAFAATPQQAALRAVASPRQHAIVERVNIAGPYAAVLTSGGTMEGAPVRSAILVKHFAFGWQALELLNFGCRLQTHITSAAAQRTLMSGMPPVQNERACAGESHDGGSVADVEAVRRLMRGPLVPSVVVSGRWALGDWYGAGGGETLFHHVGSVWRFVAGGGGLMEMRQMREYHVPRAAWCVFRIHDAPCPSRT